jgi:signal transduction histidine kinase
MRGLSAAVEPVLAAARPLGGLSQTLSSGIGELQQRLDALQRESTRSNATALRSALAGLIGEVDTLADRVRVQRASLSAGYQRMYDSVTLMSIMLGILGMVVFGALIMLFFGRLASDIRGLGNRARDIVTGYRGAPIAVTRTDEVGQLMQDINNMEAELVRREAQIEISRQQYFHREKMAAVGSLAAGIAHEIGNPIAAIAGVAQAISEEQQSRICASTGAVCRPDLILEQTTRIASITREISEFSAQRPAESGWLDLNGLVRSTCNFMRYDRRFRDISLTLELDNQLPAAMAVADHVVQVLMNLLANAADAVHDVQGRVPVVVVRTRCDGDNVCLEVRDNGCGMDEKTRSLACEPFFTTKPPGKGTGLGLAMSRSMLENAGARLEIESLKDTGSTVRILLPTTQVTQATEQ